MRVDLASETVTLTLLLQGVRAVVGDPNPHDPLRLVVGIKVGDSYVRRRCRRSRRHQGEALHLPEAGEIRPAGRWMSSYCTASAEKEDYGRTRSRRG